MSNTDLLITLTHDEDNSNNVTIAFTMGVQALSKGYKVELLLLSNAVFLAKKGYSEKIDIGAPFRPVEDLLKDYIKAGGVLKVCSACMVHNGVEEKDLIDGVVVIKAEDVIDSLMEAKKSLQLN